MRTRIEFIMYEVAAHVVEAVKTVEGGGQRQQVIFGPSAARVRHG